nr:hypothetical protein [Tanacetum cinerariifolium]
MKILSALLEITPNLATKAIGTPLSSMKEQCGASLIRHHLANYRSVGRCKLRDRNIEESWALLEDLALYDNESWSDLRDFAKLVKAVSLPQDVLRLVSNFMASQDARLSMFEVDFNQQQGKITKKIDTVLKAITDQITGALPSDTVKNPKLNLNFTAPVLSARSYPMGDPQCSSHPLNSINTVKTCSKETNHSQKDQLPIVTDIRARQTEEPEQTLEDEFKDLHLNLPVLKFLAHALMYNAILDKYVEILEARQK